jgi:hypothetical protein
MVGALLASVYERLGAGRHSTATRTSIKPMPCWRDQKIGIASRPKCRVGSNMKNASFERNYSSIFAHFLRECGPMNVFCFVFSTLQISTITECHASAFCRELLRVGTKTRSPKTLFATRSTMYVPSRVFFQ